MIVTIVIVAAFNNPTQLTNAYGFAVATVMFVTTVLISLQIRYIKHLPIILGVAFLTFFGFLDGARLELAIVLSAPALTYYCYQVSSGVRH